MYVLIPPGLVNNHSFLPGFSPVMCLRSMSKALFVPWMRERALSMPDSPLSVSEEAILFNQSSFARNL